MVPDMIICRGAKVSLGVHEGDICVSAAHMVAAIRAVFLRLPVAAGGTQELEVISLSQILCCPGRVSG